MSNAEEGRGMILARSQRFCYTLDTMMVKVKVCGITSATDALMAAAAGADALGFNFFKPSPRYVTPEKALPIRMSLPPFVASVGIFVDEPVQTVRDVMEYVGLDYAQLHGHEGPRKVRRLEGLRTIKAVRIRGEEDLKELERYPVCAYLLDTFSADSPGGTGQTCDWELARRAASRQKVILAGGLNPDNVADAVCAVRPFCVDVASGVEIEPGRKERKLLTDFIRRAKEVRL